MISLYIDADACPVKQEVYRVAERHAGKGTALKVFVVSNAPIAVPRDGRIEGVNGFVSINSKPGQGHDI